MSIQTRLSLSWNQAVLVALSIGFVIGACIGAVVVSSSLPRDKVQAATQIDTLRERVDDLAATLDRAYGQNNSLQRQLTDALADAAKARRETEEAKAAKLDRSKIVKQFARTWRLDSATGEMCLLLATEAFCRRQWSHRTNAFNNLLQFWHW